MCIIRRKSSSIGQPLVNLHLNSNLNSTLQFKFAQGNKFYSLKSVAIVKISELLFNKYVFTYLLPTNSQKQS